jgi:spore germination cell wall hydrolase CwlJ-like protein
MRLRQCWTVGAFALVVLSGAAFADVTVSHSNDPTEQIEGQMASLLAREHQALNAMPEEKLSSIAVGPKVDTRTTRGRKGAPLKIEYDDAWLAAQPAPSGDAEWQCLRQAIYFEARGETLEGQFAVAEVILNRRDVADFPGSVCAVVGQGGKGSCQFSFICDGRSDKMTDTQAMDRAGRIARLMLDGAPRTLTQGATYFHTRNVHPVWSRRFSRTAEIGAHMFYRKA